MNTSAPIAANRPAVATPPAGATAVLSRWRALTAPFALFILGLATQLTAAVVVSQPLTEASSYYVAVARNVVLGRGLAIDAIWSYATPPLVLPRPAFELWQPMASFVAALPMTVVGPTFNAAQLGFALLGATLAPLAWLVARDAARRLVLPPRREQAVTLGAGVLTALSTPLLLAGATPDSTLPFAVVGVAACLIMPRALGGDRRAVAALGILLGLAYLTRMEAVWFGLTFVLAGLWLGIGLRRTASLAALATAVGALVALPWWLRNLAAFGTPLPGQLADNVFLTRNEQIFAYLDRPTLAGFLAQGAPTLLGNIGRALWHDLVNVIAVPSAPVVVVALITVAFGLRRGVRPGGPLALLLAAGALCYLATSVLFPVATLWGTFEHSAGPLHVALIVTALIGMDAFVARVREWRSWPRSNAWLGPAGLTLVSLPLTVLALTGAGANAATDAQRIDRLAQTLPVALQMAGVDGRAPIISDRPIWLSAALERPFLALPDEPPAALARLAADFRAGAVVVTEPRGEMPATLRAPDAAACFTELSVPDLPAESAVFVVNETCR